MENNRKYFIVPLEYAEELDLFTNEQLGELFRALLHYSAYGTDSDSNSFPIKLMYRILKKGIDQNFEKYEEISDQMETDIASYLHDVSDAHLSDETKAKMRAMLREISEIESIGDSCYKIAVSLNHKRQNQPKEDFTVDQYRHIDQIMKMADESLTCMSQVLKTNTDRDVMASFNKENELNAFRDRLKNLNLEDIDNGLYSYQTGIYYMDIVNECEKLGDYVINVVEARADKKEKKQ